MYLGVVVAIVGVAALLFGSFSYTDTKPVLDAGPIHIATHEDHNVSIPVIAGIVILIAGLGLIVVGRRAN
jgi:xanthosine utilization system XapX-like protein